MSTIDIDIDIEALPETEELSASEQAALKHIIAEGELPQSDLWKALDLSSRAGSRIATSLAEKGFIEREETTHKGRVTYLLTPTATDQSPPTEASTTPTRPPKEGASQPPGSAQSPDRSRRARETAAENEDEGNASIERQSQTASGSHHPDTPTSERQAATNEKHGLNDREQQALALIEREGDLPQSELWKSLDITSRTGSRVATTLEDKGLIEREQTVYEGQRTYLLSPRQEAADLDFSLLIAGNRLSPLIGEDSLDPIASDAFTHWLLELAANEAQEH